MLTASGIFYDKKFTRHLNFRFFAAFRFLYLYGMAFYFTGAKARQGFLWDRKHHLCFMWINVLFRLRWRCSQAQMREEILYTFIAMDDRKAARKILHSIFRNKTTEKGRQIILFFEDSLPRSGRMFACLQNKRKNAVKFLIFFSRIVLGVIYVSLLSLLPFKEDFLSQLWERRNKNAVLSYVTPYIVSRKFLVETCGCENLILL